MEKNTFKTLILNTGEKIELTLSYYRLYLLKSKNEKEYKRYNSLIMGKFEEELEMVEIIYIAYLCANLKSDKETYTFEEFLQYLPDDRETISGIFVELIGTKKKEGSPMPSSSRRTKQHQK